MAGRLLFAVTLSLLLAACASGGRRIVGDSGAPADTSTRDTSATDTGTADSGRDTAALRDAGGCSSGLSECAGGCVDLSSDDAHCGTCRNPCGVGEACMDGTCASICPAGAISCSDTCVDPSTDTMYCGASAPGCTGGEACAMGETCEAGVCTSPCGMGETACGGACVDLGSDDANCGMCGVACGMDESCVSGACMAVPTTTTITFPATGDTRVGAGSGTYFWRLGDYVEGTRMTTLSTLTSVSFDLQLVMNGLTCDTQDVTLSINGTDVGTFSIAGGATSVMQSYSFAPIAGPTYTLRLETTRQVASGCGASGYADDVTVFTLGS